MSRGGLEQADQCLLGRVRNLKRRVQAAFGTTGFPLLEKFPKPRGQWGAPAKLWADASPGAWEPRRKVARDEADVVSEAQHLLFRRERRGVQDV